MKVNVKLFAGARELVGCDSICLEMPAGATIGELRSQILKQHVELEPLVPHAMFAINTAYGDDDTPIPENCDIACIPPVSGG